MHPPAVIETDIKDLTKQIQTLEEILNRIINNESNKQLLKLYQQL